MQRLNQNFLKKISNDDKIKLEKIVEVYENEKGNIISLLQQVQEQYGYLPEKILYYLSEELKIPIAEIYGIATFYSQFCFAKKGKYNIICCNGTGCHVKGAPLLLEFLENQLNIKSGQTTKDKQFSLEVVRCLGCCAISPVCIINDKIYGNLSIRKLGKIIKKLEKEEKISLSPK
ncbi:MAG: NADH-quinone oxidoreductase subunit NuoE [Promethearchaeota archaeon]